MPFSKDPEKGGTNKDGTKSSLYCSYCYVNGAFTQPDFSATEMKAFCIEKMKEQGFPGFLARIFATGIPRLERWKNK
ncbi:MAG: zinc ribbon domain-containing protein [Altibacter sp.]|nr:zinc ribbon domain-containing protein [Altibacter sp.]